MKINKLLIAWCTLLTLGYVVGFTDSFDTSLPGDSDPRREGAQQMRRIQDAVQQRQDVDHYWPLSGDTVDAADVGKHRFVTFQGPNTLSDADSSEGILQIKDVTYDGLTEAELCWVSESSDVLVLTCQGRLYTDNDFRVRSGAPEIFFEESDKTAPQGMFRMHADADTFYLSGRNTGDDGWDAIFQTDRDGPLVMNSIRINGLAEPSASTDAATKNYVDTNVGSANYTPTSYTGGASVDFPNGLEFRHGYTARGGSTTTINYADFTTACISLTITPDCSGDIRDWSYPPAIQSVTKASAVLRTTEGFTGFYWQAWGY
jgi:hypothetical protein